MEDKWIYIGIDPGVDTVVAIWNWRLDRFVQLKTYGMLEAMQVVGRYKAAGFDLKVIVEDATLRVWIPRERDIRQAVGRAMGAGSVMRDCQLWKDYLESEGIDYVTLAPKDAPTKVTAQTFARLTGYEGRTNEHSRDAAMKVWKIVGREKALTVLQRRRR